MEGKYKGLILISIIIIVFLILSINIGLNKERIDIAGSTSVQPLGEELANSYSSMHPYLQINVQGGGSAMGIRSASQKIADIGMSSKELSDTEKEGLNIIELGKEGIVVGVYKNNTIDDLSIEELKKIFSGEITNWKELGGADEEIHVISREDGSGTRSSFERIVMGDLDIRKDAIIQSSTEAV
jgi:phosphate transport system substrate-binding protein